MANEKRARLWSLARLAGAFAMASMLAACGGGDSSSSSGSGDSGPGTLNVIAGSELKDLEPYYDQIQKATGVRIVPTYSGTLAGIDRINGGETFDAAWFANARYLLLGDSSHRVKAQERIMLSPVVLGVKQSVAKSFGWTSNGVTWKEIGEKSGAGSFRFAMTNPASSNSGFSAVIAVASALAGASDALKVTDVNAARLKMFFKGQTLTSGSSGWLIDAYVHDEAKLDGIVNYEASLLALNKSGRLHDPLVMIYPKEGILTADYPLLLLNADKQAQFDKVVAYLKTPDFQATLARDTFRRPVVAGVALPSELPKTVVNEVSFPNSLGAVDGILERYLNENRVAAHSFYVIDTSGSMDGDRIDGVRKALDTLAGGDPSLTGRFARFDNREKVTLISFSTDVTAPVDLTMHSADDQVTFGAVRDYAKNLNADGNTAIYCALEKALDTAASDRAADGPRYRSIVLMTDGENNRCDDEKDFETKYAALPADLKIKIFPILFGEGDPKELQALADITGGKLFDAKSESLSDVFKEIRGYQ